MMELPFKAEMSVLHWCEVAGRFLVIYDYMQFPQNSPARNLVAHSMDGSELWRAESISALSTDAYVNFISKSPLVVGNFAGYDVTIDPETGTVLNMKFTK
jgi:hypothetical protein